MSRTSVPATACDAQEYSSRICERGTKSCVVHHSALDEVAAKVVEMISPILCEECPCYGDEDYTAEHLPWCSWRDE